jgi:DNA primase
MSTGLAPDRHRLGHDEIERARRRWDLVASEVALKRKGRELAGLCPFHSEKTPSFFVVPDKGFLHCMGCGWHGDAIDFVMQTHHRSFTEAVHEINGTHARPPRGDSHPLYRAPAPSQSSASQVYVNFILHESQPVGPGTGAYFYLQTRGLISNLNRAPTEAALAALRAHPSLDCTEAGRPMPALVAPITSSEGVTAVQRIWVAERIEYVNGVGPKDARAELRTRKKTLGQMLDGAVRMGAPRDRIGLAEGVEIPDGVTTIRIYGDNGDTGLELAHRAAQAYFARGYKVEIRFPEPRFGDWNDQLLAEVRL